MNPIKVADFSVENGYLGENSDTFWTLMTEGATSLGLTSEELSLSKERMIAALDDGKLIICSMEPGDFTKKGHFILIRSYENGLFYVNDPNSEARSKVGWDYERLSTQISNMWAIGASASSPNTSQSDATQQDDSQGDAAQTDTPQQDAEQSEAEQPETEN